MNAFLIVEGNGRLTFCEHPVRERPALVVASYTPSLFSRYNSHMSTTPLYKALLDAGADEMLAERAVESLDLIPSKEVATKTDLAQLEVRLTWRLLGGIAVLLGIAIGLLKLILG